MHWLLFHNLVSTPKTYMVIIMPKQGSCNHMNNGTTLNTLLGTTVFLFSYVMHGKANPNSNPNIST